MERIVYNDQKLKLLSYGIVANAHPEWAEARQKEIAYSQEQIDDLIKKFTIRDLAHKLVEDDGSECADLSFYQNQAKWVMDNIQPALIQNINEYIDGTTLSVIKIHGVSICDLMHNKNRGKEIHFLDAICAMIYWKENNYIGKDFCQQFLMR